MHMKRGEFDVTLSDTQIDRHIVRCLQSEDGYERRYHWRIVTLLLKNWIAVLRMPIRVAVFEGQ